MFGKYIARPCRFKNALPNSNALTTGKNQIMNIIVQRTQV